MNPLCWPRVEDPDAELVARARTGAADAITALIRRHGAMVYRLALRLTTNPADAEEVTQEVCMQLTAQLATFRGEARLATWLHRVTINAALMYLRRERRHVADRLDDALPAFDRTGTLARLDLDYGAAARADELLARHDLAELALAALRELPEPYRIPFVLRDLEELGTAETAALLGLDPDAVRQRVHRARLALRARLAARLGAEP